MSIAPDLATYATYRGYITVDDYAGAPTGTDVTQVLPGGDVASNRAALAGVILRASSAADRICEQVLGATVDTESGRYRLHQSGEFRIPLKNTPILEVLSVSVGTSPATQVAMSDVTGVWIDDKTITIPYTGSVCLGGYAYVTIRYVSGWATAVTTLATTAGATSVTTDNVLGFSAGQQVRLYDGGNDELVQVASTYVTGASPATLAAPLLYDHQAGKSFSTMPPAIRRAVMLLTSTLIKQQGSQSIVLHSINEEPDHRAGGEPGLSPDEDLAKRLLSRYTRVW